MLYDLLFERVLARMDAERAHALGSAGLGRLGGPTARRALRRFLAPADPVLRVQALGRTFSGPLGVAAGFDKDGRHVDALGALGFAFVEIGTVTARPQPGNPRPRVFRLTEDAALVNRMGFPSEGAEAVAARLRAHRPRTPLGVNIGKTKAVLPGEVLDDYRSSARLLAPLGDYLVVNVSSPNTPGLLDMQEVGRLRELLLAVKEVPEVRDRGLPVLVKIGPDLADADVDGIADMALEIGLAGIVATNTSTHRHGLRTPAPAVASLGAGGLSGAPLASRSVEVLRRLRARAGDRLTLVSAGGVTSADDVWARVLAGATLVQAYTGFIYGGPLWASRLNRGVAELARRHGYASLDDAVGAEDELRPPAAAAARTARPLPAPGRERP